MSIEDDLRQAVGERQGTAIKFTDIDGIGQKTAQKIRQSGRIRGPADVSDKTADELAEQAGISERRARKAIKGGGGDPDRKPRSNTGTVSAAGIRVPTGEFKPEIGDKDTAEARFESSLNRGIGRSQEAAAADKGKRAPVTTDVERWKDNKGKLDFPGVDTPTDDPTVKPKDLQQKERPATTDPPERPTQPRETPSVERNTQAPEPFTTDLAKQDISLSPEEAFEGVASGTSEAAFFGTGSRVDEQRRLESGEPPDIARGEDPFDMSSGGGALDGGGTRRESDAEPGRLVEYGGEQVDLTEKSTDDLEQINSFLSRNIDAEVEAQRAKGGMGTSDFAQELAQRQGKVSAELNRRRS